MQRVKRRTYSGSVLEQEVYNVEYTRNIGNSQPRPRFQNEEERAAHKIAISRRRHERLVNENFSPSSIYSTLTFDTENEVHTYEEAKYLRDLYCRRLKRKYPDAVIFLYMGKGKHTNRIHLHMLSEGIPEEYIRSQWKYGSVVDTDHLRTHNFYNGQDHGQDYSALANYLFDHWEPAQGTKRWKQTRNTRQPEKEKAVPVKRRYSETNPPRTPKGYTLIEVKATKYGYINFKYVRTPEPYTRPGSRRRLKE